MPTPKTVSGAKKYAERTPKYNAAAAPTSFAPLSSMSDVRPSSEEDSVAEEESNSLQSAVGLARVSARNKAKGKDRDGGGAEDGEKKSSVKGKKKGGIFGFFRRLFSD